MSNAIARWKEYFQVLLKSQIKQSIKKVTKDRKK